MCTFIFDIFNSIEFRLSKNKKNHGLELIGFCFHSESHRFKKKSLKCILSEKINDGTLVIDLPKFGQKMQVKQVAIFFTSLLTLSHEENIIFLQLIVQISNFSHPVPVIMFCICSHNFLW